MSFLVINLKRLGNRGGVQTKRLGPSKLSHNLDLEGPSRVADRGLTFFTVLRALSAVPGRVGTATADDDI
jgi:hypothetical protein